MTEQDYIQIETETHSFRFFGTDEWRLQYPGEDRWLPMLNTLVPKEVLQQGKNWEDAESARQIAQLDATTQAYHEWRNRD